MKRYCENAIFEDLKDKMVFIGGPRQVGKTTLARQMCHGPYTEGRYLNWDVSEHRRAILAQQWLADTPLVIFDELHKYRRWKQWIKGVYDTKPDNQQYLVTGSARLDVYRRGGDSLMGRYHYWRLHPLTLDELPDNVTPEEGYRRLLTLGGFPEPFLKADEREARRWQRERLDRILKEDVRDLEQVRDIQLLFLFIDALRERVGGLVTLANLARDLEIAPKTAKTWLEVVERMYIAFSIPPLTRGVTRSIRKPPKVYFYNNADALGDESARLENLVATTLLKRLHFIEDYQGYRCQLHYIRDKDGREIDFATVRDGKLEDLIEVKWADTKISPALLYYANKLNPKRAVQIVGELKQPYTEKGVLITSPQHFFATGAPWEANDT